jgi:hypothetical protein
MACSIELSDLFPDDIYFVVGVANEYINDGAAVQTDDSSFTITGNNTGKNSYVGWKMRLIRGGVPQFLGDPETGNQYFDYTPITAEVTVSNPLGDSEEIICQAYKPS